MGGRSDGGDGDEEGERTRFPCLASLRTLVATVVTALAVVVVVMVILVLHRPETIVFTSYGYVQSQDQWWTNDVATSVNREPNVGVSGGGRDKRRKEAAVVAVAAGRRPPNTVTAADDDTDQLGGVTTTTSPATLVTILLIMFAYNPSGRGKVDCNITSITVADMPNATVFFTNLTEIKTVVFPPEDPLAFSVRPQSWHRDRRPPVKIDDSKVLHYLYDRYRHQSRFRVMTRVNVTYKPLHSDKQWINATYYCWPVIFVYGTPEIPGGEVLCKTADQMDSAVSFKLPPALPPSPAPALPASAPPGGPRLKD